MYTIMDELKTPCDVNIELTTGCNHRCRYCSNFWRHEDGTKAVSMSIETLDKIIDDIIKNKVFNVVLTGGEPFVNYKALLHGVKRLTDAGVLVSCNTNLTLATREQLQELKDAGLPHILTSLSSFDPEINDRTFTKKGAFSKVVKNIINAVDIGIKISVNTVMTKQNKDDIYKIGILVHSIGASNFFVTRLVPSESCSAEHSKEFTLEPEECIPVLDQAIRVRDETGIHISSLIQFPVCFLRDVEKYSDFVGRGCSAGRKMIVLSANGDAHACLYETKNYGNVLDIGLAGIWKNIEMWRDNSLLPEECKKCKWMRWCEGGCRAAAKTISDPDFMCKGSSAEMPDPIEDYKKSLHLVNDAGIYKVRQGLRFREESGFWLFHIVGAWITKVNPDIAQFLIDHYRKDQEFKLKDFSADKNYLADLLTKKIVEKIG